LTLWFTIEKLVILTRHIGVSFEILFMLTHALFPNISIIILHPVMSKTELSSLSVESRLLGVTFFSQRRSHHWLPICQIAHAYFQLLWLPFVPLSTFHRYLSINQEVEQYWDLCDFHSFFDLPFLAFKQKFNFLFYKFYKKILQKCSIFLNQKTKTKSHLNFILTSFYTF
jgi:hypothetical protein